MYPIYRTAANGHHLVTEVQPVEPFPATAAFWHDPSEKLLRGRSGFPLPLLQQEYNRLIGFLIPALEIGQDALHDPLGQGLAVIGVKNAALVAFVADIADLNIGHGR